jgi:hypothetical protein
MPHPIWLTNRVKADAATATANARQTATDVQAQGRDHYTDPDWRDAVADAQRAVDKAEEIGLSTHDVLDASKGR